MDELPALALVTRLSTHSCHRLLAPDVADALHAALLDDLGGTDVSVRVSYPAQALIARLHPA